MIARISKIQKRKKAASKLFPSTPKATLEMNNISVFNKTAKTQLYKMTGTIPKIPKSKTKQIKLETKPTINKMTAKFDTGDK